MDLSKDLSEFIKSLNSNKVDYVVVGGYAQAYHGRPLFTGDIDILIPRIPAKIADIPVNFIAKEQYIRNKRALGRPQDLTDLDALS